MDEQALLQSLKSGLASMTLEQLITAKLEYDLGTNGTLFMVCTPEHVGFGLWERGVLALERSMYRTMYRHSGRNQVRTARRMGVNRNTLRLKLARHGLLEDDNGRAPETPAHERAGAQLPGDAPEMHRR